MRSGLIKASKVFLNLVKIISGVYIIANIFLMFKYDFDNLAIPISFIVASFLFSIIHSALYYLIADKVIRVIENSEKNPFTTENMNIFNKMGVYLVIASVMNFISNHSNILRTDLEKTSDVGFIFIGGIICFVIANMIHKGIEIKKNHEITIS
ncbi:MAG: hypothetical protein ACRC76_12375 [Proteocatella sp.]